MNKSQKYYYTYLIFGEDDRMYIGVRTSKGKTPFEDTKYMGSFTDETFVPVTKVILGLHNTSKEAYNEEVWLHKQYQVHTNPNFANKVIAQGEKYAGPTKHTPKTRLKISRKRIEYFSQLDNREKNFNEQKRVRFLWEHDAHGQVLMGCGELVKNFPDQQLTLQSLKCVARNKTFQHKGWRLVESDQKFKGNYRINMKFLWFHPEHGYFEESKMGLVQTLPHLKLSNSKLSDLALGRKKVYRSWTITFPSCVINNTDFIFSRRT